MGNQSTKATALDQGVRLVLPYPPSINAYYVCVAAGRKILSKAARAYRREAVQLISIGPYRRANLQGDLAMRISLHASDRRKHDNDNTLKALLDAIEHAGIYANDHQVADLHVIRGERRAEASVVVDIKPIGPDR